MPHKTVPRSLGPVSDLERHLPANWSAPLFNSLYQGGEREDPSRARETEGLIELLVAATGLEPEDRILELCCGDGRHAMALARRGFKAVEGVERSRYLVRLARHRAREQKLEVDFEQRDARKLRIPEASVRCVLLLGNAFASFDRPQDAAAILASAQRALVSGGALVLELADGAWQRDHFDSRSWHWIDETRFACRERTLGADGARLISREVLVHADEGVIADQFYAERLYGRAEIAALLEAAGFRAVHLRDLGERPTAGQEAEASVPRFLVIARAPHKPLAAAVGQPPYPEISVILGDPRLADSAKIEGRFRAEDLEAMERMKQALAELGEYRFTFLDNHVGLISELRGAPPAFALNFCDTGYYNDARRELHMPALLEMLEIPYSGAGPACLGLCYDKSLVRALADSLSIPVPLETFFDPSDQAATIPSVFPALIKPATGDGSVGITRDSVVHSAEQAIAYLGYLRETLPGRPALIQEFLSGAEYSVGLVGNPGLGFTVLPPLEVDYSGLDPGLPRILSYESKADPESPYWTQIRYREARLAEKARRRLVDHALLLFERLGCRDYGRFDFRADAEGEVKFLEVNPNPAWCWDGKLNIMAGFAGYSYAELLRLIVEAAQGRTARHADRAASGGAD